MVDFHNDGGWDMGFGMWFFWLALILVIVVIVRIFASNDSMQNRQDDALDILKKRFARGEIDETEFEHRKKELEN